MNKRFTEIVSTGIIKDNLTKKVYVGVIDTELIKIMNDLYDETMRLNKREREIRKDYVKLQKKYDKAIDEILSDYVNLKDKYDKAIDKVLSDYVKLQDKYDKAIDEVTNIIRKRR